MNDDRFVEIGDFIIAAHGAPRNHFYLTSTAHGHTVCLPQTALDGVLMRLFEERLMAEDRQASDAYAAETEAWVHYDSF